ncbi:Uncharacterised protein [uncultured archaeon]|nr:Uncharacterised protein [uncultured archaeon]
MIIDYPVHLFPLQNLVSSLANPKSYFAIISQDKILLHDTDPLKLGEQYRSYVRENAVQSPVRARQYEAPFGEIDICKKVSEEIVAQTFKVKPLTGENLAGFLKGMQLSDLKSKQK